MSTIFTKIINGEIPSYKVYEDDFVFAFLDINPMQKGHTLVVPKKEVDYIFDLDNEDYSKLMNGVNNVAKILKSKLNCERVGLVVDGYLVPHTHVHLIPTNGPHEINENLQHQATKEELEEVHKLISN